MKIIKNYQVQADVVRVLAALGVVVLHSFDPVYFRPDFFGGKVWWITHIFNAIFRSSVPLFVLLSGYLNLGRRKYFDQNWKKIKLRILIPLFSFFAIYTLFDLIFSRLPWKGLETLIVIYDRFNINTQSLLYFLILLFFLYLLTPLFDLLFNKKEHIQKTFIIGFLLLGAMILVARITTFANDEYFYNTYNTWISYIGYYLAGYYIRRMQLSLKQYLSVGLIFCLSLLVTIFGSYLIYVHQDLLSTYFLVDNITYFANYLSPNVIIQSIALFILIIKSQKLANVSKNKTVFQLLRLVAQNSFGIFLLHILMIYILNFSVDNFFSKSLIVFLIVNTSAVFMLSLIFSMIIRMTPLKIILGEGVFAPSKLKPTKKGA